MARQFSDGTEGQPGAAPESTLASGISIGATSLSVQAGHGARFSSSGTFSIRLEDASNSSHFEVVDCSSRSTDTLTIGATTFAWDSGDKVIQVLSKADYDEFLQETAAAALYQALADDERWLPAGAMTIVGGSPVLGAVNDCPVYLLDAASTETLHGVALVVPTGWTTADISLYWANIAGGGSGDVFWSIWVGSYGNGEGPLSAGTSLNTSAITAPAAERQKISTFSGVSVTPGEILIIWCRRTGGDAGDTLANDIGVVGFRVKRAS